ncbi:MAG: VWA domain-containing protein [Oscillochloridaceae bacterium]|nr:VWA domain-containing protein [Chloroflexaceae bacterium]MDW8389897.1 VWA domain-containing protein [Oscillochloridaceae bacterium]
MSLLAPLGLLALLTLPVIVILHMLRERRRRVIVPSLLLWQLLPQSHAARQRRRLSITLLLLLHLLVAALLALALARPQWDGIGFGGQRHLALVIDTSLSMAAPAPGAGGSRLDAARIRARSLLAASGASSATLIAAGPQAQVIDGDAGNGARLVAALARLQPAGVGSDVAGALTLAEASLRGRPNPQIIVLTDAALPALAGELATRAATVPIRWETVGGELDNRAIVAFAARPRSGTGPVQVYARVANYGGGALRTVVRLYGDDALLDARPVMLRPDGEVELTWTVPRGIGFLHAEVDGDDPLPADDRADLSLAAHRPVRALLVSEQPAALERALRAVPGVELTVAAPSEYRDNPADLTIFDGFLPAAWPSGGVLAIHPPRDATLLAAGPPAPISGEVAITPAGADLLEGISLGAVEFGPATSVTPPAEAVTLLSRAGQPLIFRWRFADSVIAVWAFDLSQGNLTTRLAFPLLVARTVRDLTPPAAPASTLAGTTLSLPVDPRATVVEVTAPDGTTTPVDVGPEGRAQVTFNQIGRYTLVELAGDRQLYSARVGVNAGAASESDLRPRPVPGPVAAPSPRREGDEAAQPLWPWLVAVALLVILGEWVYVHARRSRAFAES